jgi:hypothetical protein
VPDRDQALRRMIESLKPGGWLLIEDFDAHWLAPMAMSESAEIALADKVMRAFRLVLEQSGVDLGYGRRCSSLLRVSRTFAASPLIHCATESFAQS